MTGVDLESGKKPLRERSPFIDVPMINCADKVEADKFFDDLEARSSPRLIKTHYPFEFLPPNLLETCKVLYVCRNVKDVCVSPSSVISLWTQSSAASKGFWIEPRRTLVGKHSRRVAVSVSDLLQEYIMHASPDPQVCTCEGSVGSNLSQTASGLRRLPHEKHWRPAVLSGERRFEGGGTCLAGSTSSLTGSRRGGSCLVISFCLMSFLWISFLRKSSCGLFFLWISFLWKSFSCMLFL